jgi:acyl carrier protein phosphodiesterase
MNFLAHAHLSGKNHEVLFGNFIADAVKGKNFERFEKDIQLGIKLHRMIDSYTDNHPVFRSTLNRIRKDFGKYSGIVVDIYYDHFLAKNWNDYHNDELRHFAKIVYGILKKRYLLLPSRTKRLLPFLITQNWLVGYANLKDLSLVFYGMDRRTGLHSGMSNAVEVLVNNYDDINRDFDEFYPELILYSSRALTDLQLENL